jgi:hypothetical protein
MPFDGTNFERRVDRDIAILKAAREGIAQPGGWHQGCLIGNHRAPVQPRCADGWLAYAGQFKRMEELFLTSSRLLGPALPWLWRHHAVPEYNDRPGRTQKQMVALFDRAIRLAEERARMLAPA